MTAQGTSLRRYALTRLALVIPMVFILLTFVFVLMRIAPGDPVSAALGGHAPPKRDRRGQAPARLRQADSTSSTGTTSEDIASGDLGTTITDRRAVTDIIRVNGAATLELTFFAMLVAIVVGVSVGILAGRFRDTSLDVGGRLFGIIIYATPVFFLGLLAQLFFGSYLGWLPVSDRASPITQATLATHTNIFTIDAIIDGNWGALKDVIRHLILPAVTLGLVTAGVFIRLIRVNVIRTMKDDYIEAARARGIDERSVVYHHAFRNALVPVITIVGLTMALLLGGAVLTETTFNWPGLGHELVNYLANRDYAAVQGIIIVFALDRRLRQCDHRLRQRVHRPADPLLMSTTGGARGRCSPDRGFLPRVRRAVAPIAEARGTSRVMLWAGIVITVGVHPDSPVRAGPVALRVRSVRARVASGSLSSRRLRATI